MIKDKLQEKEFIVRFNIAGYDLEHQDLRPLDTAIWLAIVEGSKYLGAVGNFKTDVLFKKDKS